MHVTAVRCRCCAELLRAELEQEYTQRAAQAEAEFEEKLQALQQECSAEMLELHEEFKKEMEVAD